MKIVDTTFLIDLSKNRADAVNKSYELDNESRVFSTEVSVFEVALGIFAIKGIDHQKKVQKLEEMFRNFEMLTLNHPSAIKAAEIAGSLIREGKTISDADCMIAGIALSNGIDTILTRDKGHFGRIRGLKNEDY